MDNPLPRIFPLANHCSLLLRIDPRAMALDEAIQCMDTSLYQLPAGLSSGAPRRIHAQFGYWTAPPPARIPVL
jgi:hypothetical protein